MDDQQIEDQSKSSIKQELDDLRASNNELRTSLRIVTKALSWLAFLFVLGVVVQWLITRMGRDYNNLDSQSQTFMNVVIGGIFIVGFLFFAAFSSSVPNKHSK